MAGWAAEGNTGRHQVELDGPRHGYILHQESRHLGSFSFLGVKVEDSDGWNKLAASMGA